MALEKLVENFHRKWDAFPGSARLIDREHTVLAVNGPAKEAGFEPGLKCYSVPTGNNHRDCLFARALETGAGQANVSKGGMMRCWIPVDGYEGVLLHLSFKSPERD